MTQRLVVCFRWHDPATESARYLAAAARIWRRVAEAGGESLSWSADRYSFAFDARELRSALRLVVGLLCEAKTHAVGLSARELSTDVTGRSWGAGLVFAEGLAGAASPGEVLLDPTLPEVEADRLATLGTIPVRVAGERVGGVLLLPGACPDDGFRQLDSRRSEGLESSVDGGVPETPGARLRRVAPKKPGQVAGRDGNMKLVPSLPGAFGSAPDAGASLSTAATSGSPGRMPEPRAPGRITAAGAFLDDTERPSVLSALRAGDAPGLLRKAAEMRHRDRDSSVAESLEGLALIVQGSQEEGVRALREGALRSERHSGPSRVRARLALAVGYSLSGDRFEAVMAGLGALARARECGDMRGEVASAQLLSNLAKSDGQAEVATAWANIPGRQRSTT